VDTDLRTFAKVINISLHTLPKHSQDALKNACSTDANQERRAGRAPILQMVRILQHKDELPSSWTAAAHIALQGRDAHTVAAFLQTGAVYSRA
jgi:aspartokinase-like uncharacterized kinase